MNKDYFVTLAHYNQWANEKIYDAVAGLSAEEFTADCDVFFKNMQGTLNHILVGDLLWFARLDGAPRHDLKLNDILYPEFSELRTNRKEMDDKLISFCQGVDEEFISSVLKYKTTTGLENAEPVHLILGHVFNHQTHHRGHVHACLTRLGKQAPDIDIIYFARANGS